MASGDGGDEDGDTVSPPFEFGWRCTVSSQCLSGACVDETCCRQDTCGTCERCDVPDHEGDCYPATVDEGRGCQGPCTHCVQGACEDREEGDGSECEGTCQACQGGTCAVWTGESGSSCIDAGTYCCDGACVDPVPEETSDEYASPCGVGACAGGTWSCAGSEPSCTSQDSVCTYCVDDYIHAGTCSSGYGVGCEGGRAQECDQCYRCVQETGPAECVVYRFGDPDRLLPFWCDFGQACDGAGNCLKEGGSYCTYGSECLSGQCAGSLCTNPEGGPPD